VRPLTRSLSPAEIAEQLDLSPDVVTALIESGYVLCHSRAGESRVPLAQLEAFFRDRLMLVYAAEHASAVEATATEAPAPAEEPKVAMAEVREPEPQAEDKVAAQEPQIAAEAPPAPRELPEQRRLPRYIPRRQIDGMFGDTKFTIIQLSANGLRIRHKDPLVPGTEAKLTFALLRPARSVVLRTRVVWTSLARSGDERFSISGLRVLEHQERLVHAVNTLRAAHELQPERRVRDRRSEDQITNVLSGASDEEIALVTSAMQKFAEDPVEASRWYGRGRFALAEEHVRRHAPEKPRDREEVLGIWEYLERQVELEKVAGVVAWTRGAAN
jgi:hypothetical protein